MIKRDANQWAVSNLAIIGRAPEIFSCKAAALHFVLRDSEDKENPVIKIDDENKSIDYRGRVYL